jgi:MFS transporter, ACS family, D-galactonate transporter
MDVSARSDGHLALTAAAMTGPARRNRIINVTLVFVCQVCHGLTFVGVALFLPLIREDLQINYTQAGVLSAAATLSYALAQIPAGYLADRFGARRLFFIGLMGWSILSLSLGLIHSYWLAVLNLFVAGLFRALLFAPGLRLLASWFPPERGATAMSLYMVGGYSGNILLSLVGPGLAAILGWRAAFMAFAVLGVAAAIAYYTLGRARPGAGLARPFSIGDVLRLFEHRILWICGAIQFVRFSAVTGFSFWLPSLLVADRGFTLQAAGLIAALSAVLSVPANALGGYLSDRLGNPPLVIGSALAALACCSMLLVRVESVPALLLVVAAGSIFLQLYFGPLFFIPLEILGQRAAGTATGFSNLFANLGGLTTAYALGAVKDTSGSFTWGFIGIGILCLAGAALSLPLARIRNRALEQKAAAA